jgi:hypothetical protein
VIEPNWILVFSKKRGRWWVRLLACGRYHHVKAMAYLPAMQAWLFYDVKFNGTRLILVREDDPGSLEFLHDYLDGCDLVAMPRLPIPKRAAPQAGFWCTIAMKHLVGISTGALRPDRLWRASIAAGGKAYESDLAERSSVAAAAMKPLKGPQLAAAVLNFLKTNTNVMNQQSFRGNHEFERQRSQVIDKLRARICAFLDTHGAGGAPTARLQRAFERSAR